MVKIKRQNITSVSDDMEKLNNSHIVIEMKLKQPNCKNNLAAPKTFKHRFTI